MSEKENDELNEIIARTKGTLIACGYLASEYIDIDGGELFNAVIPLRDSITAAMNAYKITRNEKLLAAICHLIDALANVMAVQLNNDRETRSRVKRMINDWFDYWIAEKKRSE